MKLRLLFLPLALAACSAIPAPVSQPPAPQSPVVRPVTLQDRIDGRWTVRTLNGQQASGLWLEFDGGSARYNLACNGGGGHLLRNGDKLSINQAVLTEKGCDRTRMQIDDAAIAILRRPMTMEFTPPDRLRLINESGTIELVRAASASTSSYRAAGTEPFWALTIDSREIVFIEANAPGVRIVEPLPKVIHGFAGDIYQGKRIGVNIVRTRCSDGMSDRVYPDKVQLRVDARSFEGCGGVPIEPRP
jgi:uncharacterized membrane protein